jgi:hypothetical protein
LRPPPCFVCGWVPCPPLVFYLAGSHTGGMGEVERPKSPSAAWNALEEAGAVPEVHREGKVAKRGGKQVSLVGALREYVAKHPEYMEHVVMGLIHKARQGDVKCAQLLFDRLDGAVVRQVESRSEVVHVKRLGFVEPDYEVLDAKVRELE